VLLSDTAAEELGVAAAVDKVDAEAVELAGMGTVFRRDGGLVTSTVVADCALLALEAATSLPVAVCGL
jgi:hypothetical protein